MTFVYKVVDGDVLEHKFNPPGKVVIPHVVNTLGIMGSGVAAGIAKKWPKANYEYIDWYGSDRYDVIDAHDENGCPYQIAWKDHKFELGEVQFVSVSDDEIIANMVGQKGIGPNKFGMPPIRLDSLKECIFRLRKFVVENDVKSIASPKFGSLRAGSSWEVIWPMVEDIFRDVCVTWITYNFVEKRQR